MVIVGVGGTGASAGHPDGREGRIAGVSALASASVKPYSRCVNLMKAPRMTMEQRLGHLESELVRAKRSNRLLLTGIAIALAFLMSVDHVREARAENQPAAAALNEIHARAFILEDANGKARAKLTANKDGTGLTLYDENGKNRATLGVTSEGPGLVLFDENGKSRVALDTSAGAPGLSLSDENGVTRANLVALNAGPGLALSDERGENRARLVVVDKGPGLVLLDENGKSRARLAVSKSGPGLVLSDKSGNPVKTVP